MRYVTSFLVAVVFAGMAVRAVGADNTTAKDTDSTPAAKQTIAKNHNSGAKQRVLFNGETLELAFESDNEGDAFKEYIPAGEKLDSWTRLAAIYQYPELDDPQEVARALVARLQERTPQAPSDIMEHPETGAVLVDFVIWPEGTDKPEDADFVEFNIFKYEKNPAGGLTAQQFAMREYKDIKSFLGALGPQRQRLLDQMAREGLRIVTIEKTDEQTTDEPTDSTIDRTDTNGESDTKTDDETRGDDKPKSEKSESQKPTTVK